MSLPFYWVRRTVDYHYLIDHSYPPLKPGSVDRVTVCGHEGFLRLLCPCGKCPELYLNTYIADQDPFYTYFIGDKKELTISQKIVSRHRGCEFWIKEGWVIGLQSPED